VSRDTEVLEARRAFLLPAVRIYYEEPLVLEEGRRSRVRDTDGREYLDAFGGILSLMGGFG
jgi:acetylornithine/succinyldiaminopimelate/putrescine aminotransferase